MLFDVLFKARQIGVYTFFLSCSTAQFHLTEIIQVIDLQYRQKLTDEQVNSMDWSKQVHYLKRSPVTLVRNIDYVFQQLFDKVILSGMHTAGQVLNFDERREFCSRRTEYMHAPVSIVDATEINKMGTMR